MCDCWVTQAVMASDTHAAAAAAAIRAVLTWFSVPAAFLHVAPPSFEIWTSSRRFVPPEPNTQRVTTSFAR